jgi:aminoglycoside/choline kinase family phosphotransferase
MSISPAEEKAFYTRLHNFHYKHFGKKAVEFQPLSAHGSDRFIVRLTSETGTKCIGIVNQNTAENKAFISFGKHFRQNGLNVPEVYSVSDDIQSYLMEDLGDETLLERIKSAKSFGKPETALYKKVLDTLPLFQIKAGKDIDYSLCYQFGEFAEENINYDINYFVERFLKVFYKNPVDENLLNKDFDFLKSKLKELPRDYFLYRDFQSRNIMIKNNELYFIDFQSGRRGALVYDLASLLYDAKADIPQQTREQLIDYYFDVIKKYTELDNNYKNYFWYFAVIRILQAMGAYGFLGIVKGKKKFLESIPLAIRNINFILQSKTDKDRLKYLRKIFRELASSNTTI